jgi:hypothetical protein
MQNSLLFRYKKSPQSRCGYMHVVSSSAVDDSRSAYVNIERFSSFRFETAIHTRNLSLIIECSSAERSILR